MLYKMVSKSTVGLTDVDEATSGTADTADQVEGCAGEPLSDMEGLFCALNGGDRVAGCTNTIINVEKEEMGNCTSMKAEEGLFHVSYEEAAQLGPIRVPVATPLVYRQWEELKEKLLRLGDGKSVGSGVVDIGDGSSGRGGMVRGSRSDVKGFGRRDEIGGDHVVIGGRHVDGEGP
eukprot:g37889.t1